MTINDELVAALEIARRYVADMPIVGDDDLARIDAALSRAKAGGGDGVLLRRAIYDWLRDDVPLVAKMAVMPEHVDALQVRLAALQQGPR